MTEDLRVQKVHNGALFDITVICTIMEYGGLVHG